jgi:hypothetical protein
MLRIASIFMAVEEVVELEEYQDRAGYERAYWPFHEIKRIRYGRA